MELMSYLFLQVVAIVLLCHKQLCGNNLDCSIGTREIKSTRDRESDVGRRAFVAVATDQQRRHDELIVI